jgi:hypothetical protein
MVPETANMLMTPHFLMASTWEQRVFIALFAGNQHDIRLDLTNRHISVGNPADF